MRAADSFMNAIASWRRILCQLSLVPAELCLILGKSVMNISSKVLVALCLMLSFSCSKDSLSSQGDVSGEAINFVAIGEDAETVYQYRFSAATNTGTLSNLTQEQGIKNQYITIREVDDVLSFYSFSGGNYTLVQLDVETKSNRVYENFYQESDKRSILWGTDNANNVYMGFFGPIGTTNFGLLTIDLETGAQQELMVAESIQNTYQPFYYQGKLLLTYLDGVGDYQIAIIDTDTNTIQKRLDFGKSVPNILINEDGDFAILQSAQGEQYSYAVYDAVSLEPILSRDFALRRYFFPGALKARFIGDRLIYFSLYVQPAFVPFGPAFFDFSTDSETLVDMEGIVAEVEQDLQKGIILLTQGYDAGSQTYLIGYANKDTGTSLEGGVIAISLEGKLIKTFELTFVPTYFLSDF